MSLSMWAWSLALLSGLRSCIATRCGVGHRCSLNLFLLWQWCRLTHPALIQLLVWELPYATCVALKIKWSSHCGASEMSPNSIQEDSGSIPCLAQCVVCKCSLDPKFLWLWVRQAAVALISLGTSICHGWDPNKEKKRKKEVYRMW